MGLIARKKKLTKTMNDIKKKKGNAITRNLMYQDEAMRGLQRYKTKEMRGVEEIYFAEGIGIITFCILELHD